MLDGLLKTVEYLYKWVVMDKKGEARSWNYRPSGKQLVHVRHQPVSAARCMRLFLFSRFSPTFCSDGAMT